MKNEIVLVKPTFAQKKKRLIIAGSIFNTEKKLSMEVSFSFENAAADIYKIKL